MAFVGWPNLVGPYRTLWDLAAQQRSVDAYLDYLQDNRWPSVRHYQLQADALSVHIQLVNTLVNEIAIVRQAADTELAQMQALNITQPLGAPEFSSTASTVVCDWGPLAFIDSVDTSAASGITSVLTDYTLSWPRPDECIDDMMRDLEDEHDHAVFDELIAYVRMDTTP